MNGNGNANYNKNIPHKNRHLNWHFIYFGYSRDERKARVYVKFTEGEEELNYDNVNHYIPSKLYVYLGHDMPTDTFYSGQIGYARVVLGQGSYKKDNNFDVPNDPFAFSAGLTKLLGKTGSG
jgi:hypothetical protein